MSQATPLTINYLFQRDMDPETLAVIQQTAVEQHAGLEKGADKDEEIRLKTQEIEKLFDSSGEYTLIVAYASSADAPNQNPLPIGYILASPDQGDDSAEVIDDLYAMRRFKIAGKTYDTKNLELGKNLLDQFSENVPDHIDTLKALPLEGSEPFYTKQGFRGKNNSTFTKQLK